MGRPIRICVIWLNPYWVCGNASAGYSEDMVLYADKGIIEKYFEYLICLKIAMASDM